MITRSGRFFVITGLGLCLLAINSGAWWVFHAETRKNQLLTLTAEAIISSNVKETERLLEEIEALGVPGRELGVYHYLLGRAYSGGHGAIKDEARAAYWYERAAINGNPPAPCNSGCEAESSRQKEQSKSVTVICNEMAAKAGYPQAIYSLALIYQQGSERLPKDTPYAMQLLNQAASKGHNQSLVSLAHAYEQGKCVPKDKITALEYFRRAAEQGDAEAQFNVGRFYSEGISVEKDNEEARVWYRRSADQGHTQAQQGYAKCLFEEL